MINERQSSRPRQASQRRRRATLVRFSDTEFDRVRRRAAVCRTPVARYLRETALGTVPEVPRGAADAELLRHLARIGNNLNQLTRVANETGQLTEAARLRDVLDILVRTVRRVGS